MTAKPPSPFAGAAARWCERLALFVLLVVVGLRPLVQEQAHTEQMAIDRVLDQGGLSSPGPEFSVAMTGLILVSALLLGVARLLCPSPYRPLGIEAGLAVVAVVAIASCFGAGNKRLAINETANWLALPVLAIVLRQLLTDPGRVRLTLAVLVASGATFAFQCFRQRFDEFDQTIQFYAENRERIWAEQGVPLDDPRVVLYERRMYGREATGFFSHSNVAGGYLMLAAFVTAAVAWAKLASPVRGLASKAAGIVVATLVLVLGAAAWQTGSLGAMVSGLCGVGLLAVGWTLRRRLRKRPFRWLAVAWGAAVTIGVCVVTYGTVRGSLPSSSLAFRWQYWTGSASLVIDHLWLGVGTANFGDHYLRYKDVTSPEEIQDPHNLLVTAAAQWGLPGVLGLLGMIVGGSIRLAHGAGTGGVQSRAGTDRQSRLPDSVRVRAFPIWWTTLLCLAIFHARWLVIRPLNEDQYGYVLLYFYLLVPPCLVWFLACQLALLGPPTISGPSTCPSARARTIIAAGLAAALLHATIDFTLYHHGSATALTAALAVAGVSVGAPPLHRPRQPPRARVWAAYWSALGLLAVAAFLKLAALPTVRTATLIAEARAAARSTSDWRVATDLYERASADPLDPGPALEMARWLSAPPEVSEVSAEERLARAQRVAGVAVKRNPHAAGAWRLLAGIAAGRCSAFGDLDAGEVAVHAARRAVQLYPASPEVRVQLANALLAVAEVSAPARVPERLTEAVLEYKTALRLDARRDPSEIRRLAARQRDEIAARMALIEESLRDAPP